MELWMQKKTNFNTFAIYEISRGSQVAEANVVYNTTPVWQLAEPTGAVNNVRSDGVITTKLSVNGAFQVSSSITANTTRFVIPTTVGLQANGTIGTAGQVLTSNGTTPYWSTVSGGSGTVTSIGIGTGLTSTQSPLTTTGTISLTSTGITAGTYTGGISGITVDAQGRISSLSHSAGYITSSGSISGSAGTFTSTIQNSQFNSIGVGTAASTAGGEIRATNDITAFFSDARLKTDIQTITDALIKVKQINGVTYINNDLAKSFGYTKKKRMAGVLAQEIESVLPEAVTLAPFDIEKDDEDGNPVSKSGENYKTVKYDKLVPLLIEAIKDLSNEVDNLKTEIRRLKK
jgi:hypothetical protein